MANEKMINEYFWTFSNRQFEEVENRITSLLEKKSVNHGYENVWEWIEGDAKHEEYHCFINIRREHNATGVGKIEKPIKIILSSKVGLNESWKNEIMEELVIILGYSIVEGFFDKEIISNSNTTQYVFRSLKIYDKLINFETNKYSTPLSSKFIALEKKEIRLKEIEGFIYDSYSDFYNPELNDSISELMEFNYNQNDARSILLKGNEYRVDYANIHREEIKNSLENILNGIKIRKSLLLLKNYFEMGYYYLDHASFAYDIGGFDHSITSMLKGDDKGDVLLLKTKMPNYLTEIDELIIKHQNIKLTGESKIEKYNQRRFQYIEK